MMKQVRPDFETRLITRRQSMRHSRPISQVRWLFLLVLTLAFAHAAAAPVASAQQPANSAESKESQAPKGTSHYAKLNESQVYYVRYGKSDEALVLIHGWSCNVDYWRDHIPDLAKRSSVIAIDLPGHGKSDKPQITYSMDLFAQAVDAVLRDAKVKRAVLVGHSMGTPVARQFYRKYPEKTLGIVIVDGSLRPFGDKKLMETVLAGFRGPNYKEVGRQMFAGMAGPNLSPEIKELVQASFLNTPQHVLVGAMEGMGDESIWGLDKINVPVLAVMAKSPFWPPDTEQFYRSLAPNLDFQMWEGVGHFLHMERPKQFNDAVIAFLDKNKLLTK